jgi:FAD/FMN-containing dehydrogenase
MMTKEKERQKHNDLEGCAWPDPDPVVHETAAAFPNNNSDTDHPLLSADDVSGMSQTPIDSIVFPRTESDVEAILQQALLDHKRVSIRGTQHSMGGHSLCRDAIVMDTKYLAHMEYNNNNDDGNNGGTTSSSPTVTVGAGCRWSDVIRFLNPYSKSPATMQSYCSFSVGGTVAVNAHGITTDTPLAADVVAFRLVRYVWDENEQHQQQVKVETIVCQLPPSMGSTDEKTSTSRPTQTDDDDAQELFRLVLGGYGLFGIVTEVTLRVTDNVDLELDSLQLNVTTTKNKKNKNTTNADDDDNAAHEEDPPSCDFVRVWEACQLPRSGVEVKLARLNLETLQTASLYIFR